MTISNEQKYDMYKKYRNILLDYDEILSFYPDYYKIKLELENTRFLDQKEADAYFEENYKKSNLYKKLVALDMAEDEIYDYMQHNKDAKYRNIKSLFESLVNSTINLCKLVDYICHYPKTWPVPREEEKDPAMEELLEKYDIIVRYYLGDDMDKMKITSDDVIRIVDKINKNLYKLCYLKEELKTNDWLLSRKIPDEEQSKITKSLISEIEKFPLSRYQENGKSQREEGKYFLRVQHGKNII